MESLSVQRESGAPISCFNPCASEASILDCNRMIMQNILGTKYRDELKASGILSCYNYFEIPCIRYCGIES
jgi:hypothetical protein